MTKLILLMTLALAGHLVTGQGPVGDVTCRNNHTVDIVITNVDDRDEWVASDWQLQSSSSCAPTLSGTTVTYTGLKLPDCAFSSEQFNDSIKYVLKISATKGDPGAPGQLRAYDHLYYVSCDYDNQNFSMASFVPIVNRNDNDTGNAFFTFSLDVYTDDAFNNPPTGPIALDIPLYLRAEVETQSSSPNLDLFPVSCWASSNADEESLDNKVILITDGCGSTAISADDSDTLQYNCTNGGVEETFSINSFRFYNFPEGSSVYFHCNLRVCLSGESACECPSDDACYTAERKRRSVGEYVEEIHVK